MNRFKLGLLALSMAAAAVSLPARADDKDKEGKSVRSSSTNLPASAKEGPPPFVGGVPGTPCRRNGNGPKRASPC